MVKCLLPQCLDFLTFLFFLDISPHEAEHIFLEVKVSLAELGLLKSVVEQLRPEAKDVHDGIFDKGVNILFFGGIFSK